MYIIGTLRQNNRGVVQLNMGTPPFQHETLEDATREATRLMGEDGPQRSLIIFNAVREIVFNAPPIEVRDLPNRDNEVMARRARAVDEAIADEAILDAAIEDMNVIQPFRENEDWNVDARLRPRNLFFPVFRNVDDNN